MTAHLARIGGITTVVLLCIVYPFLPVEHDHLAVALSVMGQAFGALGLLLVPIGGAWLAHELRARAKVKRNVPVTPRGYHFAMASGGALSLVAMGVAIAALITIGPSLGLLTAALGLYGVSKLARSWRPPKESVATQLNPAPLYLIIIPIVAFVFQVTVADSAAEFSTRRAIANSAELIADIESYRVAHGRYPASLLAVHHDYYPSVGGIEKYHYAPNGTAYDLFFEQPLFLFDDAGSRELVVYNRLDEHAAFSHAAWILELGPRAAEIAQGWYSVRPTSHPHWKAFRFD